MRISPSEITTKSDGTLDSGRSGKSKTQALDGGTGSLSSVQRAAVAVSAASTAPGGPDAWVSPIAADALLLRGRLALLDGKLRVGHISRSSLYPTLLLHKQKNQVGWNFEYDTRCPQTRRLPAMHLEVTQPGNGDDSRLSSDAVDDSLRFFI